MRNVPECYFRSSRAFNRTLARCRGTFDGVWLGAMSASSLAGLDEHFYSQKSEYVDDDYNRKGFWAWESSAIDNWFVGVRRVAVSSAGGGREVLALLDRGIDAVGYEPHPALADYGARLTEAAGWGSRVHRCARDRWPAAAGDFDGAIIGWGAYMLTSGRTRRVALLRDVARSLPRGAPVLLSFYTRSWVAIRWRTVERTANLVRDLRGAERVEPGDALAPNFTHFFTREEIQSELEDAGIRMVDFGVEDYGWAVGAVDHSHGGE